jgi:hypothetical protein
MVWTFLTKVSIIKKFKMAVIDNIFLFNPASHGWGLWDPDHVKICYIFVMS